MGRRENGGFRGYLVRVQTKEGRVFRHRKLRMVLDKSQDQGITLQTHRLAESVVSDVKPVTPDTSGHDSLKEGLPVVAWRSYPIKEKDSYRRGDRGISRALVLEETTLDEFLGLAKGSGKLPGDEVTGGRGVGVVDADDEQLARLYRLGILYDGPSREQAITPTVEGPAGAAADSAYQADSLDTIRHAEPLYSVRHVVGKRRGKRTPASTSAATPVPPEQADSAEADSTKANVEPSLEEARVMEGFRSGDLPLFAFDGVWEDGEGQTIDGRALWNDLEEFEYVVLRDDDLASKAGSWVELDSVLGTDDDNEGDQE
ncbi:hypothetical protein SBRCBS47491_002239 [Sporothrix bragantina]|uniref:Uncharacterized protein n=1 Tax=Sporothrix bragantina TaxID=671064 RepID=A0ABP0B5A1_9PEZI